MAIWLCITCRRTLQHMGVPNRRAMHRRRKDGPVLMMNGAGGEYRYDYRDPETR